MSVSSPEAILRIMQTAFADSGNVDVRGAKSGPYVDVRAYPGRFEGKDWEIEFAIDVNAPALPKAGFWSARPDGIYEHVIDTGDVPPPAVVGYARGIARRIASGLKLAQKTDLEREAVLALHNVVLASNANDRAALTAAIQQAWEISSRHLADVVPEQEADQEYGAPSPSM